MAYALSGLALTIAAMESDSVIINSNILPALTGPVLAVIIIAGAFGYAFITMDKVARTTSMPSPTDSKPEEATD